MKESLASIYQRHRTEGDVGCGDKGSIHSYIEVYEKLLAPYRENCNFLEIGLAQGHSMRMWAEYLGETCSIGGVDLHISFDTSAFDRRFTFIEADATKPLPFIQFFDVILDDGSHMLSDQVATYGLLAPHMRKGGLYCIEDILSQDAVGLLAKLHNGRTEVFDFRYKGRFDDVLIAYHF